MHESYFQEGQNKMETIKDATENQVENSKESIDRSFERMKRKISIN